MSGPELTVGGGVIAEMVRLAAIAIPGVARVARGGPAWRAGLAGPPIVTRLSDDGVRIRVWIVARPGQQLVTIADDVRAVVATAVERLLGMRLESVIVTVDGVGA
ncbi:MAG: Asp23/Gls24 family envelope stress response protein [Chloroflexi bacterium]|nr:Asp23/Gls24 family envelope stress response protein [Chloroflexota bacterium]